MIRDRIESGKPIQPLDFHPHWLLKRPPPGAELPSPEEVILDPVSRRARRNVEAEEFVVVVLGVGFFLVLGTSGGGQAGKQEAEKDLHGQLFHIESLWMYGG